MENTNYTLSSIERLLPDGLDAVDKFLKTTNGKVPKAFKGYISSFGASVVLNGLLPAIAIYCENKTGEGNTEDKRSKEDRSKVLDALWYIMPGKNLGNIDTKGKHLLLVAAIEASKNQLKQQRLLAKITDAAIALKHAMRTFEIEKD